jgi:aquaporin Z
VGGEALGQLWLFWVAPIAGAIIAGVVYPLLTRKNASLPAKAGFAN